MYRILLTWLFCHLLYYSVPAEDSDVQNSRNRLSACPERHKDENNNIGTRKAIIVSISVWKNPLPHNSPLPASLAPTSLGVHSWFPVKKIKFRERPCTPVIRTFPFCNALIRERKRVNFLFSKQPLLTK